jgi:hypothetical protein
MGNLAAKRVADKRGLKIVTVTVCVQRGEFRKYYDPDQVENQLKCGNDELAIQLRT